MDAYRRYPGTVPHYQQQVQGQSQGQGRSNEVTLVVDPAPMYPGPPVTPLQGELPPSYDEAMRMDPGLHQSSVGGGGNDNLVSVIGIYYI